LEKIEQNLSTVGKVVLSYFSQKYVSSSQQSNQTLFLKAQSEDRTPLLL